MNDKNFTNDNEFIELKKLLKEIPKISAPDDFEFNLMNKIRNQNFEVKSEKKKGVFSWALTPAIAFAATVFIFVFVFSLEEDFGEDPWKVKPQLIEETIADVSGNEVIDDKSEVIRESNTNNSLTLNNNVGEGYPLSKRNSVNLDDALKRGSNKGSNGSAQLAGSNNSPFTGFFLREIEKPLSDDSLNTTTDSLKANKK